MTNKTDAEKEAERIKHEGWKRGAGVKVKATGERGRVIRCSIPGSSKHRYDIILSDTLNPGVPVRTFDASQDELELIAV